MKYERIEKAVFLERENRFVAYVELDGKREKVKTVNDFIYKDLANKMKEVMGTKVSIALSG